MRYVIVSNYSWRVFDLHHLHPIPYPDREMHHHRRRRRRETTDKQVAIQRVRNIRSSWISHFTPIIMLLAMSILPESLNPVRFQSVPVPNIIGYIRWMRSIPSGLRITTTHLLFLFQKFALCHIPHTHWGVVCVVATIVSTRNVVYIDDAKYTSVITDWTGQNDDCSGDDVQLLSMVSQRKGCFLRAYSTFG